MTQNNKKCSRCKTIKSIEDFYNRKTSKDGKRSNCKVCGRKTTKKWEDNNKDYVSKKRREYYLQNKQLEIDNALKWQEKNIERKRLHSLKWQKNNPGKTNARNARRRCTKLNATPCWLSNFDKDYIRHIYIQAKQLEILLNIKHEVDHIVPLKGKSVCGLHVPWNLQILTKEENCIKSNKENHEYY